MVKFTAVISDPKHKRAVQQVIEGSHANALIGKKIGDEIDGIFVGLPGYKLIITGGSDKDGFPMRRDVPGSRRVRILMRGGTGFHPHNHGLRERRTVRGNTISSDIVQINMKVKTYGARAIETLLKTEQKTIAQPTGAKK